MKRFVILGLATALTVPLIYAFKQRDRSSELVQEEQEQEVDEGEEQDESVDDGLEVDYDSEDMELVHPILVELDVELGVDMDVEMEREMEYEVVDEEVALEPFSPDVCLWKLSVAFYLGLFLSKLFSRGVFYKILMARLNRLH